MSEVLIILTTTINVNNNKTYLFQKDSSERLNIYLKAVKQWLEKTNFKICLVENSGYTFPELADYAKLYQNRFEIISFDEITLPEHLQHLKWNPSKGASEMYSIIHAFQHSKFHSETEFVIKITGRYYIDALERFLLENNISDGVKNIGIHNFDNRIIALKQNENERCEILGIHVKFFSIFFELCLSDYKGHFYQHVEYVYENRFKLLNPDKVLVCPAFDIEPTQMGGLVKVIDKL